MFPVGPIHTETYGVKTGEHIPGEVVHRYLRDYAKKTGVYGRIKFDTKVVEASKLPNDEGWMIKTHSGDSLFAKRLIVATGLTSEPFIPDLEGADSFSASGLLIHSRDFKQYAGRIFNKTETVTVLGGSKSAWDVAYACAIRNVPVNLIIRESGQGPTFMAPAYVTPFKAWLEKLVHKRFLTWLSPCIWGDEDGYGTIRRLLHGTWLGRKVVDAFWYILSTDANDLMGYDKHLETHKLKPRHSAFWTGSGLGILNFEGDFLQLVREGKIKVHVADISRLSEKTVHLSNGTTLSTDAIVCATGWKARPPLTFLPAAIHDTLGLPQNTTSDSATQKDIAKADATILSRFPRLAQQPATPIPGGDLSADKANKPFTLHRFIAPPNHILAPNTTIAFAGMITTISTSMCASLQALWISAYFDGKLTRLPASTVQAQDTALLHARFGRWRYACGYGARFPDFVFDAVPYLDMLCKDLGLEWRRKGGVLKEIFGSYGPDDYQGIVEEWAVKNGYAV